MNSINLALAQYSVQYGKWEILSKYLMADCWIAYQILTALGCRKAKHIILYLQIMLEVKELLEPFYCSPCTLHVTGLMARK